MTNENLNKQSTIDSPCIRNCCLNEKDICLGCFRQINEITNWRCFTQTEKVAILDKCTKRKEDHQAFIE